MSNRSRDWKKGPSLVSTCGISLMVLISTCVAHIHDRNDLPLLNERGTDVCVPCLLELGGQTCNLVALSTTPLSSHKSALMSCARERQPLVCSLNNSNWHVGATRSCASTSLVAAWNFIVCSILIPMLL